MQPSSRRMKAAAATRKNPGTLDHCSLLTRRIVAVLSGRAVALTRKADGEVVIAIHRADFKADVMPINVTKILRDPCARSRNGEPPAAMQTSVKRSRRFNR